MTEVRAVLVDLYDTLAWTEWPDLRGEIERRLGVTEADLLRAYVSTRPARSVGAFGSAEGDVTAVLQAAGVEPEPELVAELAELTGTFLGTGVRLWEDSLPTLRELRARGIRTALISNCDHGTRPVIERLGLSAEVDQLVLSFEVGVAKPDPGIYRAALELLEVPAEQTLFADDQAAYCDGAAALGIGTVLVQRPDASPAEGVSAPGGHRVIGDLRSLLELV